VVALLVAACCTAGCAPAARAPAPVEERSQLMRRPTVTADRAFGHEAGIGYRGLRLDPSRSHAYRVDWGRRDRQALRRDPVAGQWEFFGRGTNSCYLLATSVVPSARPCSADRQAWEGWLAAEPPLRSSPSADRGQPAPIGCAHRAGAVLQNRAGHGRARADRSGRRPERPTTRPEKQQAGTARPGGVSSRDTPFNGRQLRSSRRLD